MLPPLTLEQTITRLVREEWGRILAALTKTLGDLQLAEDCLQEAVARRRYPRQPRRLADPHRAQFRHRPVSSRGTTRQSPARADPAGRDRDRDRDRG